MLLSWHLPGIFPTALWVREVISGGAHGKNALIFKQKRTRSAILLCRKTHAGSPEFHILLMLGGLTRFFANHFPWVFPDQCAFWNLRVKRYNMDSRSGPWDAKMCMFALELFRLVWGFDKKVKLLKQLSVWDLSFLNLSKHTQAAKGHLYVNTRVE